MVRALRIGDAEGDGRALEEGVGVVRVAADVERELIVALGSSLAVEEVADAAVGIGLELARRSSGVPSSAEAEERDADARPRARRWRGRGRGC